MAKKEQKQIITSKNWWENEPKRQHIHHTRRVIHHGLNISHIRKSSKYATAKTKRKRSKNIVWRNKNTIITKNVWSDAKIKQCSIAKRRVTSGIGGYAERICGTSTQCFTAANKFWVELSWVAGWCPCGATLTTAKRPCM